MRRAGALKALAALLTILVLAGPGETAGRKEKRAKRRIRKEVVRQLEEGKVYAPEAFEGIPLRRVTGGETDLLDIRLPRRVRETEAEYELARLIRLRRLAANLPARLMQGQQSTVPAIGDDFTKRSFLEQPAFTLLGRAEALERATGSRVIVAVLDAGFDTGHEVLAGRTLAGLDLVDGDDDPSEVANGLDDDGDGRIDEGYGHGTFVAGLVLGVAPDARILPIRVLDDEGRGEGFLLADAIYHAVRKRADVVSLSLGVARRSPVVAAAVEYAEAKGVLVVCAAVEDPETPGTLLSPAPMSTVFSVTAVDLAGRKPAWAAAHPKVDLAAPGVSIVGPWPGGRGKTYATADGTSFSTALVAGAAALVIDAGRKLDPADVRGALSDAAVDLDTANPGLAGRLGAGRLDLGGLNR